MLNKGLQKGYIDLLSRWSYDFFARCPISLFIPRAKYPHHGVRGRLGGKLMTQLSPSKTARSKWLRYLSHLPTNKLAFICGGHHQRLNRPPLLLVDN